jgi:hypothetical protein
MRSIPGKRCEAPFCRNAQAALLNRSLPADSPYVWKDFSRFVEVAPVKLGWLVLWGRFRESGRVRDLDGQRTYADLSGARRRVADAVSELTRNPALVADALVLFDRTAFPMLGQVGLPEPL